MDKACGIAQGSNLSLHSLFHLHTMHKHSHWMQCSFLRYHAVIFHLVKCKDKVHGIAQGSNLSRHSLFHLYTMCRHDRRNR